MLDFTQMVSIHTSKSILGLQIPANPIFNVLAAQPVIGQ
jgi:hypothetical protein